MTSGEEFRDPHRAGEPRRAGVGFWLRCGCGWVSPPRPTAEEAVAAHGVHLVSVQSERLIGAPTPTPVRPAAWPSPGSLTEPLSLTEDGDVLRVAGAVDEFAVVSFERGLRQFVADRTAPRLDLSAVTFLPSAALTTVVKVGSLLRHRGRVLVLVAAPDSPAARVLRLVGLPHESD